jgi:uncharacterized protein YjbI with pentapeptide repeats
MIKTITQKDLDLHAAYLRCEEGGVRLVSDIGRIKIEAILSGADLRGANLSEANLCGADMRGADLRGANLSEAKNLDKVIYNEATAFFAMACPEEGAFIGWKKCRNNVIVKLLIPSEARRSSATTRKCRAEFVDVLEVINGKIGLSIYNGVTEYKTGERVACDIWNDDRWVECGGGIHFFITRREAELYNA